jgi:hypothetical protein
MITPLLIIVVVYVINIDSCFKSSSHILYADDTKIEGIMMIVATIPFIANEKTIEV